MTARPTVSVILPTYQRGSLIARSIRSVLAQTYRDFELLVVDDGSTDATPAEVARVSDSRIRYIPLEANRGAAVARNVGIDRAQGRFLAFQDSDDEWLSTKLDRHMRVFAHSRPRLGVVYSDMLRIRRDGSHHYHQSPAVTPGVLIDARTRFYQVCKIGIQSAVIRRECFNVVGGFNEAFPALEDLELFIRLSQHYEFQRLAAPLVRYYETDGLSQNMPAKVVARTLLLQLYRADLERDHAEFLASELSALRHAAPTPDAAGGP